MKRKRPRIDLFEFGHVRDAFKYLTAVKKEYIIKAPDGQPVSLADAIRNYQKDGDPKWPLHVMMSNLGYVAITISKAISKFNLPPEEFIADAFLGICNAMKKCKPEKAKMSYIGAGIFFAVRKEAYRMIKSKKYEVDLFIEDDEEGLLDDERLAALLGLCEVYLDDE